MLAIFVCPIVSFRLVSVAIMLTFYGTFSIIFSRNWIMWKLDEAVLKRILIYYRVLTIGQQYRALIFRVEQVVDGLEFPTSIAFLGPNDFLVLEKQSGTVKRVLDVTTLEQPVLDVSVANENERGMLGLVIEKEIDDKSKRNSHTYVFVVFTESDEDGSDDCQYLSYL